MVVALLRQAANRAGNADRPFGRELPAALADAKHLAQAMGRSGRWADGHPSARRGSGCPTRANSAGSLWGQLGVVERPGSGIGEPYRRGGSPTSPTTTTVTTCALGEAPQEAQAALAGMLPLGWHAADQHDAAMATARRRAQGIDGLPQTFMLLLGVDGVRVSSGERGNGSAYRVAQRAWDLVGQHLRRLAPKLTTVTLSASSMPLSS